MGKVKYKITYKNKYLEGVYKHQKAGQKNTLKKIASFLMELQSHPLIGTGKPEPLRGYGERNVWSRRIDQKHRLTYEVFEEEKVIEVLACYGHYDD